MRLVVTGGGTGGHIYPALAVAKEMQAMLPSSQVLFLGTKEGMEASLVKREGLAFEPVRSAGVMGKSARAAARGLMAASAGVTDAIRILRRFRPDVVLGTGGYASGPVVLASRLLRIPGAIQEQNAVPGKTNRFLSRFSAATFAAFEYSIPYFPKAARVLVTGNPVRKDLAGIEPDDAKRHFGLDPKRPAVLLLGGSRGAKTLADAGVRLAKGGLGSGVGFLFVTGREYYATVLKALDAGTAAGIEEAKIGNIIVRPYMHEMAMAYGAADLVISRAGGMTLAEITALGLPSIIVPSPNVAGNHQEYNARALEEFGAALVVREGAEVADDLVSAVGALLGDEKGLKEMAKCAKALGKIDATNDICKELIKISRGSH